ncbi:hypothetical protein EV363DRAFT_1315820 [Boletus edulis]|nr:hypothetical protein EV363DRAFT_1315820 [Boletus edulis]
MLTLIISLSSLRSAFLAFLGTLYALRSKPSCASYAFRLIRLGILENPFYLLFDVGRRLLHVLSDIGLLCSHALLRQLSLNISSRILL